MLLSVACVSSRACVAVGERFTTNPQDPGSPNYFPVAERWDGRDWTSQSIPSPPGAVETHLVAVSCATSRACLAVGHAARQTGKVGQPFAERWNGARWTIVPSVKVGWYGSLADVACPATNYCIAVGSQGTRAHGEIGLVEQWNGARWSRRGPTPPLPDMSGVSCRSTRFCIALAGAVAERWTGLHWQRSSLHLAAARSISCNGLPPDLCGISIGLGDISCASRTACTAVGSAITATPNNTVGVPVVDRWNGVAWGIQRTPHPAREACDSTDCDRILNGVSCPSRAMCMAVGAYPIAGQVRATLAERWNGRRWSILPTP
jgi:hypothetical protein